MFFDPYYLTNISHQFKQKAYSKAHVRTSESFQTINDNIHLIEDDIKVNFLNF